MAIKKEKGETTYYNHKKDSWIYQATFNYGNGETKRHAKSFASGLFRTENGCLKAGRQWAKQKQEEINQSYVGNEKRATLQEFYENSWKPLKMKNASASTDRYNSQLENFILKKMGSVRLDELSLKHINDYFSYISHEKILNKRTNSLQYPSRATVENHKKALSNLLNLAFRYKFIEYNYANMIDLKELMPIDVTVSRVTQVARRDSYSREQANILLKQLKGYEKDKQFARMCELMLYTGLRPQEICAIDIQKSIYFNDSTGQENLYRLHIFQAISAVKGGGTILKSTKTEKVRNVYFSTRVYNLLLEQLTHIENEKRRVLTQRKKDRQFWGWEKDESANFLFCHSRGKPYNSKTFSKKWTEFIKNIQELPSFDLYALRHTYATLMLYSSNKAKTDNYGATIQAIADSLGHSIDVFIKYYVHPLEEYQKKLAFVDFLDN